MLKIIFFRLIFDRMSHIYEVKRNCLNLNSGQIVSLISFRVVLILSIFYLLNKKINYCKNFLLKYLNDPHDDILK